MWYADVGNDLRPYQRAVAMLIAEKYNLPFEEARKKFVSSETYAMLADPELAMGTFSARALLDMWEVEQKTGNPRNSAYIAIDDYEQQILGGFHAYRQAEREVCVYTDDEELV